jgi:hypothetical protein
MYLDIIHRLVFCLKCRPVYIPKHNVSETEFHLRPRVKPSQLGRIKRASPHIRLDGCRIRSPKRCVLKYKQDDILDKRRVDG